MLKLTLLSLFLLLSFSIASAQEAKTSAKSAVEIADIFNTLERKGAFIEKSLAKGRKENEISAELRDLKDTLSNLDRLSSAKEIRKTLEVELKELIGAGLGHKHPARVRLENILTALRYAEKMQPK